MSTQPTDADIVELMRDGNNCRYNDEADHVEFARAVLAKWGPPAQAAEPVATQWLAEMVMSDCGCSTENQRLLDRIIDRIQQYDRANTAPQPVARLPLSAAQKQHIHNETGAGHALICLVESYLLDAHGIKGDQHDE